MEQIHADSDSDVHKKLLKNQRTWDWTELLVSLINKKDNYEGGEKFFKSYKKCFPEEEAAEEDIEFDGNEFKTDDEIQNLVARRKERMKLARKKKFDEKYPGRVTTTV